MATIWQKIFGSKAEKDMKEIAPYVEKVHVEYEKIKQLSNDELRAKTLEFRSVLIEAVKEEEVQIAALKNRIEIEYDMSIDDKQSIYTEIEKLEKRVYEITQEKLNEILPAAFAVVKDTARRFKENDEIEVTATDFDRELASKRSSIIIKGDKAYWKNAWTAGGNTISWDMVHYNVQLIG